MSKRDLKNYLSNLTKEQVEMQMLELYSKFPDVKTYYDFVFNPNEKKLIQEAKLKISNEYFPIRGKKAKLRRSTAQKFIKHFLLLGVDSFLIADLMLYNLEIAQTYTFESVIKPELFFKSMLNSYEQAVSYLIEKGILEAFLNRVEAIKNETEAQNWINSNAFQAIVERFKY